MTDDEIIFTEKYAFLGNGFTKYQVNHLYHLFVLFTCRLFELVEVASLVEESLEDAVT